MTISPRSWSTTFRPGEIRVRVRNPQREAITIASVIVDDAILPFALDGDRTLARLRSSTVVILHRWVADEPTTVGVTSSAGIETTKEVPARCGGEHRSGDLLRRLDPGGAGHADGGRLVGDPQIGRAHV